MRRSSIVEVLEVGEVTVADVAVAGTERAVDDFSDDRVSPAEETRVVRA